MKKVKFLLKRPENQNDGQSYSIQPSFACKTRLYSIFMPEFLIIFMKTIQKNKSVELTASSDFALAL